MGYARALGGVFSECEPFSALTLHETYANLTPNLQPQSLQTLRETYTKLTWNLQLYAYTVLGFNGLWIYTVLRFSEYCYILLQSLRETYGRQPLTKS